MYQTAFGIIETLAPLHVGASAGEETGNLNLVFRDQFTQTGIVPGSSIRGRFRADMRGKRQAWLEEQLAEKGVEIPDAYEQDIIEQDDERKPKPPVPRLKWLENQAQRYEEIKTPVDYDEHRWYGHEAVKNGSDRSDGGTTEAIVKFEYASLLWLPVFCPGQPVVWVTSPRLLERYKLINPTVRDRLPAKWKDEPVAPYTAATSLDGKTIPGTGGRSDSKLLFFNLGYIEIPHLVEEEEIQPWIPPGSRLKPKNLVVVGDNDIAAIHDMALFRQTRVKLADSEKKVAGGAFFNVEALPEGSYLAFPVALKLTGWKPFGSVEQEGSPAPETTQDLYFGGLESIGFGHCRVTLGGLSS
ncbi:MAG: type III-B CRISPR module RAMP protein Cmr4 [Leptolyngbya sp. SIO4C5]|nr:type III-B CRISPR module RAMP protein Cmr4 [Leptolyngbya sp. SIO4C5]